MHVIIPDLNKVTVVSLCLKKVQRQLISSVHVTCAVVIQAKHLVCYVSVLAKTVEDYALSTV